jgi:hypothetical protein
MLSTSAIRSKLPTTSLPGRRKRCWSNSRSWPSRAEQRQHEDDGESGIREQAHHRRPGSRGRIHQGSAFLANSPEILRRFFAAHSVRVNCVQTPWNGKARIVAGRGTSPHEVVHLRTTSNAKVPKPAARPRPSASRINLLKSQSPRCELMGFTVESFTSLYITKFTVAADRAHACTLPPGLT